MPPVLANLTSNCAPIEVESLVFTASNPHGGAAVRYLAAHQRPRPQRGGGRGRRSILDVGKSLCCLYGAELADVDALRARIAAGDLQPAARWIGVPTTAGTGSEVTCWATIWDPEQDTKRSLENHDNYAAAALVDPEMAAGMPVRLAVSSALDAVAHAVESYWARHTNAVSRALALEAIRTVMGSIDQLFAGVPAAHDAMARGSMLAGLAFSNTKTTACHSISYPLTMHYGIPHGAAVAMLLAPVLACNAPAVQDLDALLSALGVADAAGLQRRIAGAAGALGPAGLTRRLGRGPQRPGASGGAWDHQRPGGQQPGGTDPRVDRRNARIHLPDGHRPLRGLMCGRYAGNIDKTDKERIV